MPRFTSPTDYLVNRARRGELAALLTLPEVGLLCVSTDSGEDAERARQATVVLHSLKTGGLLSSIFKDGRDHVEPAALQRVADKLDAQGLWGEGAQLWARSANPAATPSLPQDTAMKETPITTGLLVTRLEKRGPLFNRKGRSMTIKRLLQDDDLIAAARCGSPVRGGTAEWIESAVMTWIERQGFSWGSQKVSVDEQKPERPRTALEDFWNPSASR